MKYVVFIVSVIALIWGLWIVFDARGTKQALYSEQYCLKFQDNEAMNECSKSAWKSAKELETKANWAIWLGSILAALSGFGIWLERQEET